jgi:hypothetical protein
MILTNWILPILIGFVASIVIISILYNNPKVKQAFADIGALIQLQASSIPNTYKTPIWIPLDTQCKMNTNTDTHRQIITTTNSPLYTEDSKGQPIYNYYPKTPIV